MTVNIIYHKLKTEEYLKNVKNKPRFNPDRKLK